MEYAGSVGVWWELRWRFCGWVGVRQGGGWSGSVGWFVEDDER